MADKSSSEERINGIVQWFSNTKGYGFIKPRDGSDDLFVHQSAITSDGFRSLSPGDDVEFSVIFEDNKSKAINVTAPNGFPIQRRNPNPRRIPNGNKNGCFNCGGIGHVARVCVSNNGNKGGCFNCGDVGHLARDCGAVIRNGNANANGKVRSKGACFSCGGVGHMAKDCVGVVEGGASGLACYRCGDLGHRARQCVKEIVDSVDGGVNGSACYRCGDLGHRARDCVKENIVNVGRLRRLNQGAALNCFKCGEMGHFARECPRDVVA